MANEKYDLDSTVTTLERIADSLSDLSDKYKRLIANQKDIEEKAKQLNELVEKMESVQEKQAGIIDSIEKLNAATQNLNEVLSKVISIQGQIATNNLNSLGTQAKPKANTTSVKKSKK